MMIRRNYENVKCKLENLFKVSIKWAISLSFLMVIVVVRDTVRRYERTLKHLLSARSHSTLMLLATTCEFFIHSSQLLRGRRHHRLLSLCSMCVQFFSLIYWQFQLTQPSTAKFSRNVKIQSSRYFHHTFNFLKKHDVRCAWREKSCGNSDCWHCFELTCEILRYLNAFLPAVAAGLCVDRMVNFVVLQVSIEQE